MTSRLDHSPADVLRWLMIQLGLGTNPADDGSWPIQVGNEPDSPDDLVVVYDTSGLMTGRIHRTGEKVEHRGVMVQVRGVDHPTAYAKTEAVRVAMDESVHNVTVTVGDDAYIVHAITRQSGPLSLGREPGTNRALFTLNLVLTINQLS